MLLFQDITPSAVLPNFQAFFVSHNRFCTKALFKKSGLQFGTRAKISDNQFSYGFVFAKNR